MNYYRFYPGDYAGDTQHLSMVEHGAYCLLLNYCYARDVANLPENLEEIYRICRAVTRHERAAVQAVVAEFFPERRNGRVERQLPEELTRIQVARDNGSRGGRPPRKPSGLPRGRSPVETQRVTQRATQVETSPTPTPTKSFSPTPTPTPNLEEATASSLSSGRRKKRAARLPEVKIPPVGAAAWECYSAAYRARYGVEPVRNGKTNGCLKSLVSRLPADDLGGVIAWYIGHNGAVYVASKHCVELLLRDAEGLHTEWVRGEHMTSRRARELDSLQTSFDAVEAVMKKHPEWRTG